MGLADHLLPGWPGGDPDKLRDAAREWHDLSTKLSTTAITADAGVQDVLLRWNGQSAKQFSKTWNDFITANQKASTDAEKMSKALYKVAGKIEGLHHKYETIAAGLSAALVTSVGIGILTFGVGAAAEDSAATATAIAAVDALLSSVGVELSSAVVAEVGGTIADYLANSVVRGVIVGFASDLAFQEIPGIYAGDGVSRVDVPELVLSGAAGGVGSQFIKKELWKRMLVGAVISDGASEGTVWFHGQKSVSAEDLVLSGVLGGLGGALAARDPKGEKSPTQKQIAKLEKDIQLATVFKSYYDLDPAGAARVAAKIDNQSVKDAYKLLTKYPGLFDTQVVSGKEVLGVSHTVMGKVFQIGARRSVRISYGALSKAIVKAKGASHHFAEKTAQHQAEEIVRMLAKMEPAR